jgi:hypothetical protein
MFFYLTDSDRLGAGLVYEIRKNARMKYHKALKAIQADQSNLQSGKMAEAMLAGDHRDLWAEVRKIRSSSKSGTSLIDDKRGRISAPSLLRSIEHCITQLPQTQVKLIA